MHVIILFCRYIAGNVLNFEICVKGIITLVSFLSISCICTPGPEVIKLFTCSTQLSTKFQVLIKTKIPTNEEVSCFKSLRCCIYHVNVKMPTIVGILTFRSMINFMLS